MRRVVLVGVFIAIGAVSAGYAARGAVVMDRGTEVKDAVCATASPGGLAQAIAEEKAAGAAMRAEVARLQEQVALLVRIAGAEPGGNGQD